MPPDRRSFLLKAGAAAVAGASLAGCARAPDAPAAGAAARFEWSMVTAWPADFPGLAAAAVRLGESITRCSGGRLNVSVFGGGTKVAPFEVFDAVAKGTVQMGHAAAYYWRAKSPAAPLFCAVPFGLNAQEMSGWLYHGGGLGLWRELYATFDLVPFPAGNTGMQMAGWFNREITGLGDLKGLKMRIPGLGGEVLARLGAVPVSMPASDIVGALQSGAIDAAEWMGPHNDLAFGLHRVAKYCYHPGWQEPGQTLECMVNRQAWESLPEDLQAVVAACCGALDGELLAEYTAANAAALKVLRQETRVAFRRLPDSVLAALRKAADPVLDELVAGDAFARRVLDSMRAFRDDVRRWHALGEVAYYQARG